jgi:hypothetical protein
MKYGVDQSGKIEETAKDTILCIANEWVGIYSIFINKV